MDPKRYEGLTPAEARVQLEKDMEEVRIRSKNTIRTLFQAAEALRTFGRAELASDVEVIANDSMEALTRDFPQFQDAMAKLIDAL